MLHRLRSSIHVANMLVQICATAVGLLLALGLDQWKSERAHRETARQARGFILEELKLNQKEVLREVEVTRAGLAQLRPLQAKHLKGERIDKHPLERVQFSLATLRASAWQTSMATQAVTHMEPWRVARISEAFAMQGDLDEVHRSLMAAIPTMSRLLVAEHPEQVPTFAADLATLITFFEMDLGSARDTLKTYEAAMAACQDVPPR
ncbi:MAG TPA: hypothetical protein VJ623_03880 [Holophagaceae bacterium]|nr:hypothetical protein [Holophagaceae bacterium]